MSMCDMQPTKPEIFQIRPKAVMPEPKVKFEDDWMRFLKHREFRYSKNSEPDAPNRVLLATWSDEGKHWKY